MQTNFILDYRGAEAAESRRALNRALYGRRRWAPAAAVLIPALAFLAFAAWAYITLTLGTLTVPAIVGLGVLLLIWVRLAAPRLNRRRFSRVGTAALEGREIAYEFFDEGYRIHSEHFDGFQKWAGVDRILDDGARVLIVLGPQAHFLPARLFPSAEARREFVAWAVGKLPPEARTRSRMGRISRTV